MPKESRSDLHFTVAPPAGASGIASWVLILVITVVLGRLQEVIPGLAYLSLGKVAIGLAALCYLLAPRRHQFALFSFPQIKYLVYFTTLGFCVIPFSYWSTGSFDFMLYRFGSSLLMTLLLIKLVGTYGELRKIIWGIVLTLVILVGAALLTGEGRITASGTYDPNDLSLVIVTFLPLVYYMMLREAGGAKILLLITTFAMIVAMLATQSRSGFVGFTVGLICILIRERVNPLRLMVSGIVIVVMLYSFTPAGFLDRLTVVGTEGDYNMSAGGGRLEIWKRGLDLVFTHPIVGVGPGVFTVAEGTTHIDEQSGTTGKWNTAHNSYLLVAGEFGLPGLILYLLVLSSTVRSVRRLRSSLPEDSDLLWVVKGLEISLYSFMGGAFFLSQAFSAALFLIIAISCSLEILSGNVAEGES